MNFRNVIITTIATSVLAGCANNANTPPRHYITLADMHQASHSPIPSKQAAQMLTREYFGRTLKDPDSAKYTFLPPVHGASRMGLNSGDEYYGTFMCGTINSRNSFGGYTGQAPFEVYFDPQTAKTIKLGILGDGDLGQFIQPACDDLYRGKL